MSGSTDLAQVPAYAVTALALAAAWTDARTARIPNRLTFSALLAGFTFQLGWRGGEGAQLALTGIGIALLLTGWAYAVKALGAGDVKLLMAIGAWLSPRLTAEVILLSLGVGAAMAVVQLALKGRLSSFIQRAALLAMSWMFKELKAARPAMDSKLKLPFGVAIGAAAVLTVWARPEQGWGFIPW